MAYTTITTEGGLLPADVLDAIAAEELPGQRPEDFGLERGRNLSDRIAAAWQASRGHWLLFKTYVDDLRAGDPATTVTRNRWVLPLLDVLGYQLAFNQSAYQVEARTYAISHRAGQYDDAPPVHVEGIRTSLDARPPSGRPRLSPHALLQEYLNSTEHLWGIVTNGERLRLLRDSSRFTRPAYVEFDLRAMFEGEKFSEFALMYRLLHRSRLPHDSTDAASCLLEKYHQQAVETGGRVREKLRDGVETALRTLGNGLLQHPANAALREKLAGDKLTPLGYYRQLLKLIYRLLFLMVAEDRGLIATGTRRLTATEDDPFEVSSIQSFDALLSRLVAGPSTSDRLRIYYDHYSVARLRRLAEAPGVGRGPYDDLWMGLQATFQLLEGSDEQNPRSLGLAPLDGDLFGPTAIADLENQRLRNADLLGAIRALSLYREKESKSLRRVNYGALDVEELGSVYESLLDFRPVVALTPDPSPMAMGEGWTRSGRGEGVHFDLVSGTERKTTGSYYTRPELVQELIKSALVPVIEDRLKAAESSPPRHRDTEGGKKENLRDLSASVVNKEQALLSIKVCDPACGSGHFLLAAARRLGRELARVRSGEEQPTPTDFRRAVRDVIQHCIYGVDLNPLAVDLCKLALWIEGHNAGMPLSFLDHHIKQGNSLIGATRALVAQGIPDDAYKPVTGDDKKLAAEFRKRNKGERERYLRGIEQHTLFDTPADDGGAALAAELRQLDAMSGATVAEVRAKARRYREIQRAADTERTRFNLWTAAFFQPLTPGNAPRISTTATLADYERNPRTVRADLVGAANGLAAEASFFHWELEFPQVFDKNTVMASAVEPSQRDSSMNPQRDSSTSLRSGRNDDASSVMASAVEPSQRTPAVGFDVVLGNPPWERIKLQEQEHFVDVPQIAGAANKAAREKMIAAWRSGDERQRARIAEFDTAKQRAEAESRFVRASARFPLTAVGDVNTYALFAEHARNLLAGIGRAGIIVPTGIATDDTMKDFFGDLILRQSLAKMLGFINEEMIFPGVLHNFKFGALTLSGIDAKVEEADLAFLCHNFTHAYQSERHFKLSREDFNLFNPNTRTCPVFRTSIDAVVSKKIYKHAPILLNENIGMSHWISKFMIMFHMSNDSNLFESTPKDGLFPLYEGKMMYQFDHRFASYEDLQEQERMHMLPETNLERHQDPLYRVKPCYYVAGSNINARLSGNISRKWLFGFREITSSGLARTIIFSILPHVGVGNKVPLFVLHNELKAYHATLLLGVVNSIIFDYVAKQKIGGATLNLFILKQLPVLPPDAFSAEDIAFIVPRVLELVYTAWDMQPFAEDVWGELGDGGWEIGDGGPDGGERGEHGDEDLSGFDRGVRAPQPNPTGLASNTTIRDDILRRNAECNANADPELFAPRDGFPLPPFRWNDERRAHIRAELDARIARLYGLTRDELRYILDPADVYGPDFPGETFRVLKEKETKLYGEYRTRRLVLEAWDAEEVGR